MNDWSLRIRRLGRSTLAALQLAAKPLGTAYGRTALGVALIAILAIGLVSTRPADSLAGEKVKIRPSFDGGVAWLNTASPIKIEDLKGRVVVLDFWTLCCINCIHTLPDLARLEAKYPGVLVVIGVHTPKFDNEKNTESVRKAILRYEVKHPIVNDADQKIWTRFGVRSWPTLVVLDADGNYIGYASGEGNYELLDRKIGQLVADAKSKGTLKTTPLDFKLTRETVTTPLYFPGKVVADAASKRLFIADSTHHRIVITDLDGKKIDIAGTGIEGLQNGSFDEVRFSDPQGMTLHGGLLYVADRKNHSIRALDLKKRTVATVAGVGKQDREDRTFDTDPKPALKTGLNSPWDLLSIGNKIFIAMAGHHQIWTFDPARKEVVPYAGNGAENIKDGPFANASFAQPSGLATDGKNLYVADSEVSAIRSVPLNPAGAVSTIVGMGLFEFGDINGTGDDVRLQHALGVAYRGGKLYVADTYNSKIKEIDPQTRVCTTFVGGEKLFNEPGGLSFAGNQLY
ncbi:MAG TPA: thioredoxin-like domain-containing protein, partial [Gemmataceae bacterium]|nr:thioredoxin-like domain-containing protein [Gemmataceae bacterium]